MTAPRPASWKWWVCGLLLCASAINYMDRQTLANTSSRITREFHLSQEQYGNFEFAFGWAFAAGSFFFGWLADRVPVRWLYPAIVGLWSLAGFATGRVESYRGLLICRTLLGFFESGHWPCGVKTTQRLLAPKDRTMGNSVLQSGTSIGAIFTPLLLNALMTPETGSWRFTFQAIGAAGALWIVCWLLLAPRDELGVVSCTPGADAATSPAGGGSNDSFWNVVFSRRFLAILLTITLINTMFQLLRAWLPKFLIEGRGYAESAALNFNALFYVATDIGCIGAGVATLWLHRRRFTVHRARMTVFFACATLSALSALAAALPRGWLLLTVLAVVGAAGLGLFPAYHALTQELSPLHQGKITGLAGGLGWMLGSPTQKLFGWWVDRTHSFDAGFALAGFLPLAAFICLRLLWNGADTKKQVDLRAKSL
jgi:ACS family hexuronate transporter-like MFS transporter